MDTEAVWSAERRNFILVTDLVWYAGLNNAGKSVEPKSTCANGPPRVSLSAYYLRTDSKVCSLN